LVTATSDAADHDVWNVVGSVVRNASTATTTTGSSRKTAM
jgi:hypothetical protein